MKIFQLFKLAVPDTNLVNNVVNDFNIQAVVGHSIFLSTVTSFYTTQLDFSVIHSEPILKGNSGLYHNRNGLGFPLFSFHSTRCQNLWLVKDWTADLCNLTHLKELVTEILSQNLQEILRTRKLWPQTRYPRHHQLNSWRTCPGGICIPSPCVNLEVKFRLDGQTVGSFFCINSLRVYILLEDLAKNVDKPLKFWKKICTTSLLLSCATKLNLWNEQHSVWTVHWDKTKELLFVNQWHGPSLQKVHRRFGWLIFCHPQTCLSLVVRT